MSLRLLIDAVVRQTTVLIAQLSTVAGVRSPLAHVADEVFLSLAQEIEAQGVGRKVVADMFGLALRTYQRKVQRLEESRSAGGQTLWESVLEYVDEKGPVRRDHLMKRFRSDDELSLTAVLADLTATGLVYASGRGDATIYGRTSDADRTALAEDGADDVLATLLWGAVFHDPGTTVRALLGTTRASDLQVRAAVDRLVDEGRITRSGKGDEARLNSAEFVIPAGAPQGWEASVFDHFQALANAVVAKLRARAAGSPDAALMGGTTLHFGVHPAHPYRERVVSVLAGVRDELNVLWNEVAAYNREHPFPDESATRVTFYFGQSIVAPAEGETEHAAGGTTE